MGISFQLEKLFTAGKLDVSFPVFLKYGISTVFHVVLSTVHARYGFSFHGGGCCLFGYICAENTQDNF